MDGSTLAFAGIAALLVITPGADMALVAKNGLAQGRRAALATAFGVNLGGVIWTLAAALGVAAFVRSSATAFNTLRVAGAIYLFYLGLQAIWGSRHRGERQEPMDLPYARTRPGGRAAFRQGVVSNLLNPKIAVFYTSLIPQFVAPGQSIFTRSLLLGGLMNLMAIIWLSSYACLVARASAVLRRPRIRRWLDRLTGAVLIAFGLRLATERR
jgi:RhtB (resistance to homoserine/threonine) family protein